MDDNQSYRVRVIWLRQQDTIIQSKVYHKLTKEEQKGKENFVFYTLPCLQKLWRNYIGDPKVHY